MIPSATDFFLAAWILGTFGAIMNMILVFLNSSKNALFPFRLLMVICAITMLWAICE